MADLKALVDDFVRKSYQAKNFAKEAKQAKETLLKEPLHKRWVICYNQHTTEKCDYED